MTAALADLSLDRDAIEEICRRFGVVELMVFGSQSRGEATATSDVDLLYVLSPNAKLGFAINDLEDELSHTFGKPVDLVAKRALHPMLREQVLAEAKVLSAA